MKLVDAVAEAIWRADPCAPDDVKEWCDLDQPILDDYHVMARAAIDALKLTEEFTWLINGRYGYGQGSIFYTYEGAKARKNNAMIISSHRTPWTRCEEVDQ